MWTRLDQLEHDLKFLEEELLALSLSCPSLGSVLKLSKEL
jgi:hypothetical protein